MSAKKGNKRTSILKRRQSSGEQDEENTVGFNTKRKLMFSTKNEVLEFAQCEDRMTIWGNKYETSVARSEGSSDSGGASTSRSVSTDFHSMQVSHMTTSASTTIYDASHDKENHQVYESVVEHSVAIDASKVPEESIIGYNEIKKQSNERKFDMTIGQICEKQIGLAFFQEIPVQRQVLVESPQKKINPPSRSNNLKETPSEERFSISLEEDEKKTNPKAANKTFVEMSFDVDERTFAEPRKTINQTIDMNLDDDDEKQRTDAIRKTMNKTIDMNISLVSKPSLTHFKCPEIPKENKPRRFDSPPLKPEFHINTEELNEIFDSLAQNTPSKNLCCLTPQRSASKAMKIKKPDFNLSEIVKPPVEDKICSFNTDSIPSIIANKTQLFNSDMEESSLEDTRLLLKKGDRLIANPNMSYKSLGRPSLPPTSTSTSDDALGRPSLAPLLSSTTTSFDLSIDMISKPFGKARSTMIGPQDMSINPPFEIFHDSMEEKPRETVFNQDMSLNEKTNARKSLNKQFDDDMEETFVPDPRKKIRDSIMVQKAHLNRATSYDVKGMDETLTEKIPDEIEQKSRGTIYENAMDESIKVPETKVVPMTTNRATTFQQNDLDMSAFGDEKEQTLSQKLMTRATTYQQNEMDQSRDETPKLADVPLKSRATTYQQNEMDFSTSEVNFIKHEVKNENFSSKTRVTTFQNDQMDESRADIPIVPKSSSISTKNRTKTYQNEMDLSTSKDDAIKPRSIVVQENLKVNYNFMSKPRATTFQNNEMDLSVKDDNEVKQESNKPRVTTFQNDQMDESRAETPTMHIPLKNRATTYQQNEMDMSTIEMKPQSQINDKFKFKSRTTTFQQSDMDVSGVEQKGSQNITSKPRQTTYQQNEMDQSRDDIQVAQKSSQIPLKSRGTIFSNDMELSNEFKMKSNASKPRATTFQQNEMEMSRRSIPKVRVTTFEQADMDASVKSEENVPQSSKNRPTTFQNAMEMSRAEPSYCEQSILRESQHHFGIQPVSIFGGFNETAKSETASILRSPIEIENFMNESIDKTITNEDAEVSMNFSGRQTVYDDQEMDCNEKRTRATTYQQMEMNRSRDNYRPTIFNQNEMEMSRAAPRLTITQENEMELSGIDEIGCGKIFTPPSGFKSDENRAGPSRRKNSEDSVKWHNLTDAEMLGDDMLEDISSPIEISSAQASKRQKMTLSGVSRFEEAIDDFVNLTINSSPLNVTEDFNLSLKGKPKRDTKRMSCPLLPDRDYESMLDNLVDTLKKKNVPKPRLAIDDYLEKLDIAPVKIERRLDLEPAAITERINAKKEEIRLRREERKKAEQERHSMFPEIPDAAFLMRNYIDGMNDIIRERIIKEAVIRPIFPESVNFINLLKNKFETDPHLSENWKLDTTFWFMKNFKLTHRKLAFYTISINSQQTQAEADDSTMPILFSQAILILGSNFRYSFKFSRKWQMLRKEFKNAVNGVDNFNSMCRSSNDLMAFLDFYHEKVMKTCEIVDNFNLIVMKYQGVVVRDEKSNLIIVKKRHFMRPNEFELVEVPTVSIAVSSYINNISISDVSVKGKLFEYDLTPTPNVKAMTGLMLLEFILFDMEKFVEGNFNLRKIIY